MQPLEALLDRIRWDADFGKGASFALGYDDRVLHREVVVSCSSIVVSPEMPRAFTFEDERGVTRTVPFHRVRVVYKDGVEIWRRPER